MCRSPGVSGSKTNTMGFKLGELLGNWPPKCVCLCTDVCAWMLCVHGCGVCTDVVCAWMWCVHGCSVCVDIVCAWMWCVRGCSVCMDVVCGWIWYVHGCCVCVDVVCKWECAHMWGVCSSSIKYTLDFWLASTFSSLLRESKSYSNRQLCLVD